MEDSIQLRKNNPINSAPLFSKLIFLWMLKCSPEDVDKEYEVKDIPKCPESFLSSTNGKRIKQIWNTEKKLAEKKSKTPSLLRVILKAYWQDFLIYGFLAFIDFVIVKGLQPLIISKLIKMFMAKNYALSGIFIHTGVICCLLFAYSTLLYHIIYGYNFVGQKVRVAVSSLVYEKILRLSQKSLEKTTPGQIINILSNDIARLDKFFPFQFLWIVPMQVLVVVILLWSQFEVEVLSGIIGVVLFLISTQSLMGYFIGLNVDLAAKKTDLRMRITNEIYFGMEVIKMYTWESPFRNIAKDARKDELKYLTRSAHIKGIGGSVKFLVEKLILCVTVLCVSYLGFPVLADRVFSLAVLLVMFQYSFGIQFPTAMAVGPELLIAIKRLENFLSLEEKEEAETAIINDGELGGIRINKVFASYSEDDAFITCPSVNIPRGDLCAVVGPVGSGKSSFLKLIVGELPKNSGSITINGAISFSSQKPWLFSSTIRKNIIFDQKFDELRYRETIFVCGLSKDLEQLPNGDKTVVGSRGVSLSGGQRARINLARAVYKKADIYLLDDVLSALDANVCRHVFDECIKKFLKGKTRILITHKLQHLREVDHIIIFNKGILEAQGSLQELSDGTNKFIELFLSSEEMSEENVDDRMSSKIDNKKDESSSVGVHHLSIKMDGREMNKLEGEINRSFSSVLWNYVAASKGYIKFLFLILISLFGQIALCSSDYWLAFWSEQENIREITNLNGTLKSNVEVTTFYFDRLLNCSLFSGWVDHTDEAIYHNVRLKISILRLVYTVITATAVVLIVFRSVLLCDICMKASKSLHTKIFDSLLGAPMRFFSLNPPGYTLNIFSADLGAIDSNLPRTLLNVCGVIPMIGGTICLICITNYFMVFLIIALIPVILRMKRWFLSSINTFRRIHAREKSPVFSFVSSTIDGINTIRASRSETHLINQFDGYQDVHTSAAFLVDSCNCAFGLWLEFLGIFFVFCVLFSFIILDQYVHVSGSFIGLSISQSISLVGSFQFGVRSFSETLTCFTSLERILEFTTIDKEKESSESEDHESTKNWPKNGKIDIQNLCLSHSEKPVIQNLSLAISSAEKIGIAGRTGAGKSSIISALFRISSFEGTIFIDGVDTKSIPLKTLRKNLSIIPQEPVLFSATIRFNLDPLLKCTDDKIWEALEAVELKKVMKSLDYDVIEGGKNFSVGQKQLICLARALLRKNKILILDEATANLDLRTDELIQKTIRKKFKDCTVLTVAHRLTSIIDSDRVLVMDAGRMVEFNLPHILLQNPNGHFYKLVEETNSRKKASYSANN